MPFSGGVWTGTVYTVLVYSENVWTIFSWIRAKVGLLLSTTWEVEIAKLWDSFVTTFYA